MEEFNYRNFLLENKLTINSRLLSEDLTPSQKELESLFRNEKGTPRFGRAELKFESDIDRALYIVGGKTKSKKHDDYIKALKKSYNDEKIKTQSEIVRKEIKKLMKGDFNTPRLITVEPITSL